MLGGHLLSGHATEEVTTPQVAEDGGIGPSAGLPGQTPEAGPMGGANAKAVARTRAAAPVPATPVAEVGAVRT